MNNRGGGIMRLKAWRSDFFCFRYKKIYLNKLSLSIYNIFYHGHIILENSPEEKSYINQLKLKFSGIYIWLNGLTAQIIFF